MDTVRNDLSSLPSLLGPDIDLFICCASYETRCLSIASSLRGVNIHAALIGLNEIAAEHLEANDKQLGEVFGSRGHRVRMSTTDPIATADAWDKALREGLSEGEARRILVDSTTFTHESLLVVLNLIATYLGVNDELKLAYASAAEYDPGRPDEEKWLSKGVADVRSILGFPGMILPSRKTHLIILVGYEHERGARLIQTFEPNRISLGKGSKGSATDPKHQAANEQFYALVKEMGARYAPLDSFDFPCNDPWGTKDAILAQAAKHPDCNLVIAPMNTKLSTVGCALAALENEAIQLCYAQAIRYNYANYSSPGSTCYLLDLPEFKNLGRGGGEGAVD